MQFDYDREVEAVPAIMPGSAHDYFRVTIDRRLAVEMFGLVSFGTVCAGFQGLRDSPESFPATARGIDMPSGLMTLVLGFSREIA